MRRRILITIIGVSSLAVIGFGIPLALAVRRIQQDDFFAKLEREAAAAAVDVPLGPLAPGTFTLPTPKTDDVTLAVYDDHGRLVAGTGPDVADPATTAAIDGHLAHYTDAHALAVGWPLESDEQSHGAVRAALPESTFERSVHVAWAAMGALGALVVAASALVAWRSAVRLARPVGALTAAVDRLGDGDFTVQVEPTGIDELDRAGRALDATADRLGRLVGRERAFSADASHQLRTPLTGLRLTLELAAAGDGEPDAAIESALQSVDQLETTIDDLLRLARDQRPQEPTALAPIVGDVARGWEERLERLGRRMAVSADPDAPLVSAAPAAVRQILEVLVANAVEHGQGAVTVSIDVTPGGVALEVADEGPGVAGDPEQVFERGRGRGTGIGLALARSLAEAEGGRLTLRGSGPAPRFRLLLPAASQPFASRSE